MVKIIFGRSKTGKTTELINNLKEALSIGKQCFYFVPEQYSLTSEKLLCKEIPDKLKPNLEITSFKRFSENVFDETGLFTQRSVTRAGKSVLMSIALKETEKSLTVFGRHTDDSGFITELISLFDNISEYKTDLSAVAVDELPGVRTASKIKDISIIYSAYSALIKDGGLSGVSLASKIIAENKMYKESVFFFDNFNGFTPAEYDMLETLIKLSENCLFTFCSDSLVDTTGGFGVYSDVISTIQKITDFCNNNRIPHEETEKTQSYLNPVLSHLEENLFAATNAFYGKTEIIELYSTDDVLGEATVAASIIKEGIANGEKYSDFAVITGDREKLGFAVETVFNEYNIPYFDDARAVLAKKPLARFIITLLKASVWQIKPEDVLIMLKTGIMGADFDKITDYENYISLWNLRPWQIAPNKELLRNPVKVSSELTDEEALKLKELNDFKKNYSDIIWELAEKIKKASPKEKIELIYDFLETQKVSETLKKQAEKLRENGYSYLAAEEEQLWDSLISLFDELYDILPESELDNKLFYNLFKNALTELSAGKIPHFHESVIFGEIGRSKIERKKYVIVIGVNEGSFPKESKESVILSDFDIKLLKESGVSLQPTAEEMQFKNRLEIINTLISAENKLYISCHKAEKTGKLSTPSFIYETVKDMFEDCEKENKISYLSEKNLYTLYAKGNKELKKNLSKAECEELDIRKNDLKTLLTPKKLSKDELKAYPKTLSYTSFDTYRNCAFAFFCKYGLKLKEKESFQISNLEVGSFIHYCFETAMRNGYNGKEFKELNNNEIVNLSTELAKKYIAEHFENASEQTRKYDYFFERVIGYLTDLLLLMRDEVNEALFIPRDYELEISEQNGVSPYSLPLADGRQIVFKGTVDRVDVYEKENEKYIRVIDYKTGKKYYKLSDVIDGFNLQMFIYMFAIVQNGKKRYGENLKPSALLYRYGFGNTKEESIGESASDKDKFNTSGLFVNDVEILKAMDENFSKKYIPISLNKDGSLKKSPSIATLEQLGMLKKYIDKTLKTIGNNLYSGEIPINPFEKGCEYCKYKGLCGYPEGTRRKRTKCKNKEWEIISEAVSENTGSEK